MLSILLTASSNNFALSFCFANAHVDNDLIELWNLHDILITKFSSLLERSHFYIFLVNDSSSTLLLPSLPLFKDTCFNFLPSFLRQRSCNTNSCNFLLFHRTLHLKRRILASFNDSTFRISLSWLQVFFNHVNTFNDNSIFF